MKIKAEFIVIASSLEQIKLISDFIEGLEAKPEQVQSTVRQQDAALRLDESTGSAAGNPDGNVEFNVLIAKNWIDDYLVLAPEGIGEGLRKTLQQSSLYLQRALDIMARRGAA